MQERHLPVAGAEIPLQPLRRGKGDVPLKEGIVGVQVLFRPHFLIIVQIPARYADRRAQPLVLLRKQILLKLPPRCRLRKSGRIRTLQSGLPHSHLNELLSVPIRIVLFLRIEYDVPRPRLFRPQSALRVGALAVDPQQVGIQRPLIRALVLLCLQLLPERLQAFPGLFLRLRQRLPRAPICHRKRVVSLVSCLRDRPLLFGDVAEHPVVFLPIHQHMAALRIVLSSRDLGKSAQQRFPHKLGHFKPPLQSADIVIRHHADAVMPQRLAA